MLVAVCIKLHPKYTKIWITNLESLQSQPRSPSNHLKSQIFVATNLHSSITILCYKSFLNWFRKFSPVSIQQTLNGRVRLISIYGISAAENNGCCGWLTLYSLSLFFFSLFSDLWITTAVKTNLIPVLIMNTLWPWHDTIVRAQWWQCHIQFSQWKGKLKTTHHMLISQFLSQWWTT